MKTFQEFTEILLESITIKDGELVFAYNDKEDETGISSKLGKKHKGEKFVPFSSTTETVIQHKVLSVYSVKGTNKTEILKAIKKQKVQASVSNDEYEKFLKRTAIFIDSKILRPNKIETILVPSSSSSLINDVVLNITERNPSIKFSTKSFEKNIPDEIEIDHDNPKITPEIVKYLEKQLEKAKVAGYFAMKEIKASQFRKFIKNFLKLTPDKYLNKIIDGKKVALIDDILASGNTTAEMMRNIENYSPDSLIAITLFKT